jgi:hypothetical protein
VAGLTDAMFQVWATPGLGLGLGSAAMAGGGSSLPPPAFAHHSATRREASHRDPVADGESRAHQHVRARPVTAVAPAS